MNNRFLGSQNKTFQARNLIMLKHNSYNDQVAGNLTTSLTHATMENVKDALSRGAVNANMLNVQLANGMNVDLSRGRIASLVNGWNTERFSFLLVVEVSEDGRLIAEEIYQGYTDNSEHIGNIEARSSNIRIDPNMTMFLNRMMIIQYSANNHGIITPHFKQADSVLSDPTPYNNLSNDLVTVRPIDLTNMYLAEESNENLNNTHDSFSVEVINHSNNYSSASKMSKTSNEVGGRLLTGLITAADKAASMDYYTFGGVASKGYDGMMHHLPENSMVSYHFMSYLASTVNKVSITNFTLSDLERALPGLQCNVTTVTSHKDLTTAGVNQAFGLMSNDKGDHNYIDTGLNRFQKRITSYLYDTCLSIGYTSVSGSITNKTYDGSIAINIIQAENVSKAANMYPNVRTDLTKMLVGKLTDEETKAILRGDSGYDEVEIVFSLSIVDSVISITLNGHQTVIRVPSLCDSVITPMVSTENNANILSSDLKMVVDEVLDLKNTQPGIIMPENKIKGW